jgi:putative glycosyltransferase (TIGR04372 family)
LGGRYFSLHHRFLAWIGRLTNTIILSPHPVAIGNAAEDYYYGLLRARKEGKKLVILFPFPLPGRFKQPWFDPAILFLESDLLALKFRGAVSYLLSGIFTLYFLLVLASTRLLLKFHRFEPSGYYWRPLAGQDIIWRPNANQIKFDWALSRAQNWDAQFRTPLELTLPQKFVVACEMNRDNLGLPREAWFVCLHVREGGYKDDWDNYRNSDIGNYLEAIKEITRRGGWVIRMGDPSMTKLPALERVLDYAHSQFRSAIMDIYLVKECAFCLGTSSGIISDVPLLLGKPVVMTNTPQWINGLPPKPGDLVIFHHMYSKSESRFISIQEWLLRVSEFTTEEWGPPNWIHVQNSSEEITTAVKEFLDSNREKVPTLLQEEFRRAHVEAVKHMSEHFRFSSDELENCNEWYRFAPRMLEWGGAISDRFVEKNWFKSSRAPN